MPKINVDAIEAQGGCRYPEPFRDRVRQRSWIPLAEAAGIESFGVNLFRIPPRGWSSQMHVHTHEDEFVLVLSGAARVVTSEGEYQLEPGEMAGFPANGEAHHLRNDEDEDLIFLVVANHDRRDGIFYPEIGMSRGPDRIFRDENGEPFLPTDRD